MTASTADAAAQQTIVRRITAEFQEMPGLRLTASQAQRLFGIDARMCGVVLDLLVRDRFLARGSDQTYARASEGSIRGSRLTSWMAVSP